MHLDRGYDSGVTPGAAGRVGLHGASPARGCRPRCRPVPRWVVERTHAWMNGYGKLRRCTEKARCVVDFYLFLAAAIVVTRCLIQRARPAIAGRRPTTRRLK